MFSPEKLKERRKRLGLTQQELADQLQVNKSSISHWEHGTTVPNQKNIQDLAAILQLTKEELEEHSELTSIYRKLQPANKERVVGYAQDLYAEQTATVQLYSIKVLRDIKLSAGHGEVFYNEHDTEEVFSDVDYSYDIATWIQGDSMEPMYLSGEVALIKADGFDYDGAVYAVVWYGHTYIKRVYREEDGLRLVSVNPAYPEKFAFYEDEPRIVGKVIGHFKPIEG
ncbi:LexA family transcriptional regulator [Streptococcus cameli]